MSQVIEFVALNEIGAEAQVRENFDEAAIAGLAASIREVGVLQAIRLRRVDGLLVIVDGERRYRAARKAGLATVPAIVDETELSAAEVLQRQLISNVQREDLTDLEKATGIKELMKASGWSAGQAAAKLGMSNASVSRTLGLLTLAEPIREKLKSGQICPSAAYELAKIGDLSQQVSLANELADGRLTRDGLIGIRKAAKKGAASKPNGRGKRAVALLGQGRSITVTGDCPTLESLIEALEDLLARARKARPQGLGLSTFLQMLKDQARA